MLQKIYTDNMESKLSGKIAEFLARAEKPLLVLLGPTASGKTALSLDIARRFQGEIISTDSRQIYTEMDIATDALTPDLEQGIPHHMIGICKPDQVFTLAEFKDLALKKIAKIHRNKKLPMLVGGTGLYTSAIIEGYDVPRIEPDLKLRAKLEKEAKEKGPEYLHKKLEKLDPEAAATIHPNNLRYVIRALEINKLTGKPKQDLCVKSPFDVMMIGIKRDRAELYRRINQRVDEQTDSGLLEEVQALLSKGYDLSLPSMSSLGVKEIIPYLRGEMSLEDCLNILKQNTRHYAKRQMTWFRRYDNVLWLSPEEAII